MGHYHAMPLDWKEAKTQILERLNIEAEFRAMGVRIVGTKPNASGWLNCRAIGREDRRPSAGINVISGRYKDFTTGGNLSFFDFAAKFGGFPSSIESLRHFAAKTDVELVCNKIPANQNPSAFGQRGILDSEILSTLGIRKIEKNGERGVRLLIHRPECKGGPETCKYFPTEHGIEVVWTRPRGSAEWRTVKDLFEDCGYARLLQRFGERAKKIVNDEEGENPDSKKASPSRVLEAIARAAGIYSDEQPTDFLYPSGINRKSEEGSCPILFPIGAPCRRSVMYHVGSKTDPNHEAAFHLSCNRWSCTACSPWKKQGWAERLFRAFKRLKKDVALSVWRGTASEWSGMRSRLRGSRYCRVAHGADCRRLLIITTAKLDDGKKMRTDEAFLQTVKAIEEIPLRRGKPISATRGWLPEEKKEHRWKRIGQSPLTPGQLKHNLKTVKERTKGFTYKLWGAAKNGRYDWSSGWWYRPDMENEARKEIRDRLLRRPLEGEGDEQ